MTTPLYSTSMALRFVHCSDIHLLDLRGTSPWRFLNKRMTGAVNLALKRRKRHDGRIFDAIVASAAKLAADRLVVTGDVTNLALQSEFELVRRKFSASPVPVTVIPGNHDAYTRGSARSGRFAEYLGEFMAGERVDDSEFPFVQRFGDVALVGCSSAVPSLPLYATGRLGDAQLARLDKTLARLADQTCVRVVLVHHPVVDGVSHERHDLLDIAAFQRVIQARGAELILHGHEHRKLVGSLPGPTGRVPVHGISSGTSVVPSVGKRAAFAVYDVDGADIGRRLFVWNGADFDETEPTAA
ncbi:MAG: metallophosphoesterase [Myxococcales bacterium FL481]|nr:MAG: metallophosphoesterase [Myxococcales bacterium FL481]